MAGLNKPPKGKEEGPPRRKRAARGTAPVVDGPPRTCVSTARDLERVISALALAPAVGLDTEYSGPNLVHLSGKHASTNVHRARLTGLSLAVPGEAWYLPVEHQAHNLDLQAWATFLLALEDYRGTVWCHNVKAELASLRRGPIPWGLERMEHARLGCTQVLAWLAQRPGRKGGYGLKDLTRTHLGWSQLTYDEVTQGRWFATLDPRAQRPLRYACEDAEGSLALAPALEAALLPGQLDLYWDQEVHVQRVYEAMERAGVGLDREVLRGHLRAFRARLAALEDQWAFLVPGVLLTSSKQLQALYSDGTWSPEDVPRNTQGYSTEKEYVEWQLERCPRGSRGYLAAETKLEHGRLQKLCSTYGERMIEKANQYADGRLHAGFNATGTATGRPSSSYPNLLNLPVRSPEGKLIREAFVARPGHTLISADFSQIELRILAHFLGSGRLYEALLHGEDPHQASADAAGTSRDIGKIINFAVIYKVGAGKLGRQAGVSRDAALGIMRRFHEGEPMVRELEARVVAAARARGYGRTLGGRHRVYRGLRASDSEVRGYAERQAWNNPFQAGARDIMTRGMLRFWREMDHARGQILLQVYDDLVVEVEEGYAAEALEHLTRCLESSWSLRVPLVVSPAYGRRWSEHK